MHVVLVGAELEENLALRYLSGALAADGHRVTIVGFDDAEQLEEAAAEIAGSAAAIAGFSMVFTWRAREFAALVGRCRQLGFGGLTVAGGHFAAFHAEELLGEVPALDAVVVGEGERPLCELARDPTRLGDVAGLVWRDGVAVRRSPAAVPAADLDVLPWPTRRSPPDRYLGLPIMNLLGSRGCAYACAFCSIAAWHELCGGERHRARTPAGIAAEIGCLWRGGARLFNFHDDNFLGRDRAANLARARALGEELERQGVGQLAFAIKARPDAVEPELFALLRELGLFRVFLGIEAGTEESLRRLGRGQTVEDNERALAVLEELDLHVAFNLLVLNPDSTLADLAGNVAFLRAHADHPMNFCRTEVYAGTPLERRLAAAGRLRGDRWGRDYVIADPRAQLAFETMRRAFFDRNFGPYPLHYLSGQVDYEHQVRADFFGTRPELRRRAKAYVRRVNLNTVEHLEEIVAAVAAGRAGPALAADLAARVAADDRRLHREGRAVLDEIRDLDAARPAAGAAPRAALAASLAFALAGCPDKTHHSEMAPAPIDGGAAAPPPDAARPPLPDAAVVDAAAADAAPPDAAPPRRKRRRPPVKAVPKEPDNTHMREAAPPWDERYPKKPDDI